MKVNDRGTMKWTSIMLPEHIDALNKMWEEQEKVEKPILDEQKLEEINLTLQEALQNKLTIRISRFTGSGFYETGGKIKIIDPQSGYLWLDDEKIKLDDIVSAYTF